MAQYDYSYKTGYVPFGAYQKDKRFSYCLFVPQNYNPSMPIIIPVHGTDRNAESLRDKFVE